MSKFTKAEREVLKSWIASRSLLRMSDKEIINSIKEDANIDISQATLTRIKRSLKTDATKWFNSLVNGRSDFLAKVKESWDSLILLQKITWEEFKESEGNPIMRNKYLNLNLRINEDIINMLDSLRYIGVVYPKSGNMVKRIETNPFRQNKNIFSNEFALEDPRQEDFTHNKTF